MPVVYHNLGFRSSLASSWCRVFVRSGCDYMPKFLDVGRSNRSPGKHATINTFVGKQFGVSSKLYRDRLHHLIDCTAGDGKADDFERQTSPGILMRHAKWYRSQGGSVQVHLYERSLANAASLQDCCTDDVHVYAMNAYDMPEHWSSSSDIVFVVNDPNTMRDWALPPVLKNAPPMTLIFSTLGCNVGGLKRIPINERLVWYNNIADQLQMLQDWHDAYLAALENDSAQWAYLVNAPRRWQKDMKDMFAKGFRGTYDVVGAWYKAEHEDFNALVDNLFLTKKEREECQQLTLF